MQTAVTRWGITLTEGYVEVVVLAACPASSCSVTVPTLAPVPSWRAVDYLVAPVDSPTGASSL